MAISLAQTAIAFLIDLAERGELNPWDVNVIDVIDRFLHTLRTNPEQLKGRGRTHHEANLSESGQAFLYASMLVLLKADTLIRNDAAEEEAPLEVEEFLEESWSERELPRNLEQHLHRRAIAVPPQRRQVTLKELIEQLEMIAEVMDDDRPRLRSHRARPHSKRQAVRAIAQLAHQENLSEIAAALESFLNQYWDELEEMLDWIDFELLIQLWPQYRPPDLDADHVPETPEAAERHERVGVFWGLLYLSAQSKVELAQTEFYQDLKVRNLSRCSPDELALDSSSHILPD